MGIDELTLPFICPSLYNALPLLYNAVLPLFNPGYPPLITNIK
jgi:hypothetical protein